MDREQSLLAIKQVLIQSRRRSCDVLNDGLDFDCSDSVNSDDISDAAALSERMDVSAEVANHSSQVLSQINEALARFADGTYGKCVDCTDPISIVRLQALPSASRCLKCQKSFDVNPNRDE